MTGRFGGRGQCPKCDGVMVATQQAHSAVCPSCHTTVSRVRGVTLVQPKARA